MEYSFRDLLEVPSLREVDSGFWSVILKEVKLMSVQG